MSDGLLLNLAAIEGSDHMTSPHADEYDRDGWYRAHITELIKVVREQHAEIRAAVEDAAKARVLDALLADLDGMGGYPLFDSAAALAAKIRSRLSSPSSTHTSDGSPRIDEIDGGETS